MIAPRPALSLVLVAALAAVVHAQDVVFFPQRQLSGIVDFDVDGDGLKDSIDFDYGGISLRHGHGNGTFDPGVLVIQQDFTSVIAGDVTGDGVADLIALAGLTPVTALDVFPGTGTSFGAAVESPVPHDIHPSHQILADINGDGLADWVADVPLGDLFGPAEIDVALSGGGGTFSFSTAASAPEGVVAFALGDIDGDGDLDVATLGDGEPNVAVRLGAGDGSLATTPVSSALPQVVTDALSALNSNFAARDLDGDGLCDLLLSVELLPDASSPFVGLAVVLHADGGGQLSPGLSYGTPHSGPILLGDCNGDSIEDAVIFMVDGLAALLGDGAGGLEAPIISAGVNNVFSTSGSNLPSLVDLDGDGVLDGIFGLSFVSGRGDGSFVSGTHLSVGGNGPRDVAVADMTGDGSPDLVVPQKKNGKDLMVLVGDGHSGFEPHDTGSPTGLDVALGDLDGDGDVDIVATDFNATPETAVRKNLGTGLIYSSPAPFLDFSAFAPQLADINGDGTLDLLTAKATQQNLLLVPGDGQGGFLPVQTITTGVVAAQFELADLDSDGTPDVVTRALGQSKLELMSGLGGGAFGAPQDIPVPVVPNSFAIADLNGDGLQDLAVGNDNSFGHGLHLLFAQAPGIFGPDVSPDDSYNVSNLCAADVDRDGWPDLVIVRSSYLLQVFRNLGDGTLPEVHSSMIVDTKANLLLDDVTGDGFQDAIVWDTLSDDITVLPNLAAGFPSLGYQHGASFGTPHLQVTGAPVPDQKVSFAVSGVPTQAVGFLIAGLEFAPHAFNGGTLVPSPDVAVAMRAGVPIVGRWPELPAGTEVFLQGWFAKGGEVAGTNAVVAFTQ